MRHISLRCLFRHFAVVAAASALLCGCGSVPLTGRKQFLLVSDQEIFQAGLVQYKDYLKGATLSSDAYASSMVKNVGRKLAAATEKYLVSNGLPSELSNFAWEFNLVKDKQVNAFCMPGGKIVVYEGLLTVAQTEDELAVVIGHEIAHAVAKHSNERMSQQMAVEYGKAILSKVLSEKSALVQVAASTVFGLGTQVGVMLPYSRKHEYEADYMGIVFMEMAGYDSQASVDFWEKMSSSSGDSKVQELLSTHPSDENRVANLQSKIPEAKAIARSMR